jgi:rod shape-determining protein MreC
VTSSGSRQTAGLVIVFVLAAVVLIALDSRRTLDPLKSGLQSVVNPVISWVNDVLDSDRPLTSLEVELQQITEERDALRAEVAQLKVQLEDVERLRDILEVQEADQTRQLLAANVLGSDPTGLQKFITIDRGARDGVEVGMAVVDPYYFVGLVTEVEESTARVTLVIDATTALGAKLLDSNGIGVVYGRWQFGGRIELRHVDREVTPLDGELVVTSDAVDARTARVPGGLIIGQVTGEPVLDNQSDAQTIEVLPASDFDNLSVVAIIIADGLEDG